VGEITDIKPQKRREGRVSVYLDEEFWTGMPQEVAGEHNLVIGQQLSDEKKSEVERQISEESALMSATNLLSFRDRSEKEMRDRLKEKEYGETVIDETIKRLHEYNYLDDQAFARQMVEQQLAKGRGRRAAQHALRQSGVDAELIEVAIAEAFQGESESDAALLWLNRKPVPETSADRQKVLRSLASRGFSFDVAQEALRRHEASS